MTDDLVGGVALVTGARRGIVLATAADGEGLITAEIDLAVLAETRRRLPALENRHPGWRTC